MPPGGNVRVRAVCAEPCAGCLLPLLIRSSELAAVAPRRRGRTAGDQTNWSHASSWPSWIHRDIFFQLSPRPVDDGDRPGQARSRRILLRRRANSTERKGRVSTMVAAMPPPGRRPWRPTRAHARRSSAGPPFGPNRPGPPRSPAWDCRLRIGRRTAPDDHVAAGGRVRASQTPDRGPLAGSPAGPGRLCSAPAASPAPAVYRGHMVISAAHAGRWH